MLLVLDAHSLTVQYLSCLSHRIGNILIIGHRLPTGMGLSVMADAGGAEFHHALL